MIAILLPAFLLFSFGFFNLLGIKPNLLPQHIVAFVLAIAAFIMVKQIGWFTVRHNSRFLYWMMFALLAITYVIGEEIKGSKRWIDLFVFNFQPSEFFKIAFLVFMADFFTRHRREMDEPLIFLRALFYFVAPVFIIFKQPDLGTALVFGVIFTVLLLFAGIPKRTLTRLFLYIMVLLPFAWFLLAPYQKNRLISFISPAHDQAGIGYNMLQAIITTGSGKFIGKGLGYGTQSKLFFLPENHTDFAYSSLVEQFGFIGGLTVIILYCLLIYVLFRKAIVLARETSTSDEIRYRFLYLVGFIAFFAFQTIVNISMNIGLFPVTGITLPLISYGGSSLTSFMLGLALIL